MILSNVKKPKASNPWYVYILQCKDGTYYTGCTTDIERRIAQHYAGTGAKYCRGRGPFTLEWSMMLSCRSNACKLESLIKRMTREQKQCLIEKGTF